MKRAKIAVVVALVALVSGFQANARLAFGVKAGLNVNKMHLNHDELLDGSNRAGFTVGVMGEYTLPMIGLGVDLSLMYTRMNSEVEAHIKTGSLNTGALAEYNVGKNFLEIPLNLKYKFLWYIPVLRLLSNLTAARIHLPQRHASGAGTSESVWSSSVIFRCRQVIRSVSTM